MVNIKFCEAVNCKDFASTRDLCPKHYAQFLRHGYLTPRPVIKTKVCLADACITKKIVAKGLCWKHYRRALRKDYKRATWLCLILHAVPYWKCQARGCKLFKLHRDYCSLHYQRWLNHGSPYTVMSKTLHGMTGTPTYISWQNMIQRCTNPKAKGYANYGGRGIKVCERWRHSLQDFYDDMGARPKGMTIHRVDLDGDYEPGNCKWATSHEQALRKRLPKTNTSGYRGVYFDRGAWVASISLSNRAAYLGRYKTKEEAARMYNQAALTHFGAEAMLNPV
jgi:hypothetical protein